MVRLLIQALQIPLFVFWDGMRLEFVMLVNYYRTVHTASRARVALVSLSYASCACESWLTLNLNAASLQHIAA